MARHGANRLHSLEARGDEGENHSFSPSISADGRYVAFVSYASDLVADDTDRIDVFLRDRQLGTTSRTSSCAGRSARAKRGTSAWPSWSVSRRRAERHGGRETISGHRAAPGASSTAFGRWLRV